MKLIKAGSRSHLDRTPGAIPARARLFDTCGKPRLLRRRGASELATAPCPAGRDVSAAGAPPDDWRPHSDRSTQFALTVFRPPATDWPAHSRGGTFAAYQLAFS